MSPPPAAKPGAGPHLRFVHLPTVTFLRVPFGQPASQATTQARTNLRDTATSPLKADATSPLRRENQPKGLVTAAPLDGMLKALPETPLQYTPLQNTPPPRRGSADLMLQQASVTKTPLPYEYGPVTRRSDPNLLQFQQPTPPSVGMYGVAHPLHQSSGLVSLEKEKLES